MLLQKNTKGITFPLDDLLMEHLRDHQIFVLQISGGNTILSSFAVMRQKVRERKREKERERKSERKPEKKDRQKERESFIVMYFNKKFTEDHVKL